MGKGVSIVSKTDRIIYSILREVKDNEDRVLKGETIVRPSAKDYDITNEQFGRIVLKMEKEELFYVKYTRAGNLPSYIWFDEAQISDKGNKYLTNNSALAKTYKGIKEFASWIAMFV